MTQEKCTYLLSILKALACSKQISNNLAVTKPHINQDYENVKCSVTKSTHRGKCENMHAPHFNHSIMNSLSLGSVAYFKFWEMKIFLCPFKQNFMMTLFLFAKSRSQCSMSE